MFAVDNVHYYSFVKNALQLTLGATLAYVFFAAIPTATVVLSALGFLLAYQSVYYMNDIIDMEADARDSIKRKIKPLARDRRKLKSYVLKIFIFLIVGLTLISLHTHIMFKLVVFVALFANLLHSAGLKNTPFSGVNMLVMEWAKFATGYFVLVSAITLPSVLFLVAVAGGYTLSYGIYKNISVGLKEGIIARWYDTLVGALAAILSLAWLFYMGSALFTALLVGLLSTLPAVFSYPLLSPEKRLKIGGALTILPYFGAIAGLLLFCTI